MSTSSAGSALSVAGSQQPRLLWVPPSVSSAGQEAVELARYAGLHLDPWEELVLVQALNERADGKWSAFEVGLNVPRQNGKGSILEARELAGLFLLGERMITHTAHQFDTALEAFRRLLMLIEDTPDLARRIKRIAKSHGEEGIELKGGQRIRFRTRTKGGGRGFSGDTVILDEAMILPEATLGALMPTMAARSIHGNPQIWYSGSAVDQQIHEDGVVFARIRERGIKRDDPRMAYFEWSADGKIEDAADLEHDREAWAQANPGLGIRISEEYIESEQRAMATRTFAVERLGIGDYPRTDDQLGAGITLETWLGIEDARSKARDPVCFAFDVTPSRSWGAIGAAGQRADGRRHVEVIDHHPGTGWMVDRLVELKKNHKPVAVVCDLASPAASLVADLAKQGIEVKPVNTREHAQACGMIYDACDQDALRHLGTPELAAAIRGAVKRPLSDSWAWSRSSSNVDISPLVSVTLALWGHQTTPAREGWVLAGSLG